MLTVGPDACETIGHVAGEPVYRSSLSPAEYALMLAAVGIEVLEFAPKNRDCGGASVAFPRKSGGYSRGAHKTQTSWLAD